MQTTQPARANHWHLRWAILALFALLALPALLALRPAAAGTACVVGSLEDSGAGTLRAHLADTDCDIILFDPLILPGTITLASQLTIDRDVGIAGPGPDQLSVSGNDTVRVFEIEFPSAVTISGLTITDGSAGDGAAIFNTGSLTVIGSTISDNFAEEMGGGIWTAGSVTVTGTTFSGNSAAINGGAIHIHGAVMTIHNSDFSGNSAGSAGAIAGGPGTLTVTNSTFSENIATDEFGSGGTIRGSVTTILDNITITGGEASTGGAIRNSGLMTIIDSTISGNTAEELGGAIDNVSLGNLAGPAVAVLTVTGSTISGNSAFAAGGIMNTGGTINLTNSTLSGNTVDGQGGGIVMNGGALDAASSTFWGNSAGDGGTLFQQAGDTTFKNSIVAGSPTGGNCSIAGGEFKAEGDNLVDDATCTGFEQVADVMLDDLADNGGRTLTHALLEGSPAIDAVTDCTLIDGVTPVETDQRGAPRPHGDACDIGAFEFGAIPPGLLLWGDVDCDGNVVIGDALKIARHLLGISVAQTEPCPELGSDVTVDGEDRTWGDLDCDGTVAIGDALKTARYLLGLSVSQTEPCPVPGTEVTVES